MLDIALVFIGAVVAGFIGAQVGGGGLLTLPLLIWVGLPPLTAIATNRLGALALNFSAGVRYAREGLLHLPTLGLFSLAFVAGGIPGVQVVVNSGDKLLQGIIAASLLLGLGFLFWKPQSGTIHRTQPLQGKELFLCLLTLFLLGFYGGMVGVSVVTFSALVLVFWGYSFHQAMAYSLVMACILHGGASLFFHFGYGAIHIPLGVTQIIGSGMGAWFGARYALKKGNHYVRILFVLVVFLSALYLLAQVLGALTMDTPLSPAR